MHGINLNNLTVVACATGRALTSNHILAALALSTKRMTLEAGGAGIVAIAGQCAAVVVRSQGEHSILAELAGIVCDVEVILAAALDELLGLVECLLN